MKNFSKIKMPLTESQQFWINKKLLHLMDRFPKLELSNISIQSEGSRYKVSIIGSFASKKFRVSSVSYEFENTIIDLRKKVLNHIYRFKSYDKVLRTKFNLRLVSDPCNENEL